MPLDFGKADWNSFNANDDPESLIGIETGPETKLRSTLGEAMKVQPDAQARINRLSRESGIPQFAVGPAPDEVEFQLKLDSVDWDAMSKRSPVTSSYLTDYNNAAIAHDDIDVMESLESALTSVKQYGTDISLSFEKGQRIVESSDIGLKRMYAALNAGEPVTDDQIARLKELEISLSKEIGDYGFLPGAPMAASEQLPILWEIIQSGVGGAAGGAAAGGAVGAAAGAITGPGAVATGTAGAFLGAKWGGRLGVAKAAFDLEAGMAFNEFASLKDEAGVTVSPQIAGYGAATVGALNAALESLSFAALGRTVTPTMRLLMRNKVKQALLTESGREMALRIGGTYATAVAAESITEGLQELTNVIGAEFVKLADKDAFTDQNVSDVLDNVFSINTLERVSEAAKKGAQASLILSTPGTVSTVVIEQRQKTRIAEDEQVQIDAINTAASESKLKIRDADALKQFLNQADGDKNTNVFIDGAQASLYLGSKDRATIDADPALSMLRDQVNEASRLQTDINIPVADFAASFTGTEHFDALRPHMTLSEDTVSPFRQEQVQAETQQYVQGLMAEAQGNVSQYVEAQEIFETVKAQLVDTGTVTPQNAGVMAQVVPAWATVFAQKNGISVQEAYQKAGLTIEGPQTGRLAELTDVLEQGVETKPPGTLGQIKEGNPFLFNLDPAELQVTETGEKDITDFKGDVSQPIIVTEVDGTYQILDGHHRAKIALESGVPVRSLVIPNADVQQMVSEGIHQADMLKEWVARGGPQKHAPEMFKAPLQQEAVQQDPDLATIAEFNRQPDDFQFENFEQREAAVTNLVNRDLADEQFTGAQLPTGSGTVMITPSAKQDGMWQVTQFDDQGQPLSDNGTQTKEEALRDFYAEGRPELIETAAPLRQEAVDLSQMEFDNFTNTTGSVEVDGRVDRVVEMSPDEYLQRAFEATGGRLGSTFESWMLSNEQNQATRDAYAAAFKAGDKFPLPYVDNDIGSQDGRNRAMAAKQAGIQTIPVAVVDELSVPDQITRIKSELEDAKGYKKFRLTNQLETLQKLLQQRTPTSPDARGYFDPANTVIRLTEASDLSTFLHEFAHFMYEMERSTGSDTAKSIGSWFKRNADAVAKEASGYLKRDSADLEQGAVRYETGKPVKLFFAKNTEKAHAAPPGMDFGQSIEPAGDYMVVSESPMGTTPEGTWNYGSVNFKNPLVLEHKNTRSTGWKKDLSDMFGGKTKRALSNAVKKAGYDGILTIDDGDLSEAVNLSAEKTSATSPDYTDILAQSTSTPESAPGRVTAEDVISFIDNDTTGDTAKDRALYRAVHEQFARGFETYLMEGKAPSLELRNAFRTFARWLTQVYRAVKGNLKVNLDAEMKQVFDRMLATEDQIAAAEARARYAPMFTDALMAGMTEEEFASYQKQQNKTKDKQTETLRDKIIKELTRKQEKWWKDERKDLIEEEMELLATKQVYSTAERLRSSPTRGEFTSVIADIDKQIADLTKKLGSRRTPDDELQLIPGRIADLEAQKTDLEAQSRRLVIKLDRAAVKDMVGEDQVNNLGRKTRVIPPALRGMSVPGGEGVHPDEAAAFFGYNSGHEMLLDLITAPKMSDLAEQNAEQRMREIHGDIMNDGTIEREADEAVQNEERGKLILMELKALSKNGNIPAFDRRTVKTLAEDRIGKLSFREIFPGKYRKAEIAAAQESARMLAEGNREGAAVAKSRQVLNYYLGMAATEAKNDTMKIVDRMARYNKKRVREAIQKADGGYWEQLTKILSRFEFRKSASLADVESLNTWVAARITEDGDGLVLSPSVLDETYITHWKNVPFTDLKGISDSVTNIEHVARYSNKIDVLQEKLDFDTVVANWTDHIKSISSKFTTKETRSRAEDAAGETLREKADKFVSQMTKVPFLASWLDGGERVGLSHDIMVQRFTDALNDKLNLMDEVARPVNDMIANRSKETRARHARKIAIPEINDSLYGHQVLAVALNTGNQSNLKKMLLGEGWADPQNDAEISFDNPKLQAVLKHMTREDWEMVQKIWDQMELLYPQLAEVHRRTTGLVPPKIESTPVQTPFGEFKGGYYPVKYSPKRGYAAERNAEKQQAETDSMFSNYSSINASVNAGATNERTGFYAPILLDLSVIPDHFHETIHFITHHDAVRQMNKLINDKRVQSAITGAVGEAEFKQLKPWINDIAKDGREQPTKTFIHRAFQQLRFGVTLGAMGFKASTGIMQFFGLFTTAAELGVGPTIKGIRSAIGGAWYMRAVRKTLGSTSNIESSWKFASDKSKVLKHRTDTMDREIRAAMERLSGRRGFIAATQEVSMKHIALIQTYMVDLPTWFAAYDKTISETGDEARAVSYADWAVENLQGSGATKDMATILRNQDKIHTTFTMFMTFFSSLGNLSRDTYRGAKDGKYSLTNTAAKIMFLYALPVYVEMLMRGEFDEPEDEDERLQKYMTNLALYPVASVPFARDVASGVFSDYGYNVTPVASLLERGIMGYKQIGERAFTDEEITSGALKGAVKLTGAAFGIPGINQAWATSEHLYDVIGDGEDLTLREFIFGPERK